MRTLSLAITTLVISACHKNETGFADATDPMLTLSTPVPAEWRSPGPMIATGQVAGLSNLTVNDAPAIVDGTAWSAQVDLPRGASVVEVSGTDSTDHRVYIRHGVLAGDFGSASGPVEDGMVARVNQGGLDFALGAVTEMVDLYAVNDVVAGLNPVYEDAYGILGWNAVEINADVGWMWFSPLELEADPRTDELDVEIAIPDLEVWIPVDGQVVGIPFAVDTWLWAERAVVTGSLEIGIHKGAITADLTDAEVDLVGFDFDTSLLPGHVESLLLVDAVRTAVEDMLLENIDEMVPSLLEEQLAELELAFEMDVMGTPLSVGADFVHASVDPDGILLAADVRADSPDRKLHAFVGPLLSRAAEPSPDHYADFALSLSDDLLNRILFEVWAGGLLEIGLSTEDGGLDAALMGQLGAHEEAAVIVSPHLPPVVVEHEGKPQLQITELEAEILTPGGEHGERIVLAVTVLVDVELEVVDGMVLMNLGEPDVTMFVRDNDWNMSNETLTNALVGALPVEVLLAMIGELAFPLPSLGGFQIGQADVRRDGSGVHTGMALSLR